ncbi:hypothetical protein RSAG8_13397, partial [Rhizoctonia solani AG-8 WAC10335]
MRRSNKLKTCTGKLESCRKHYTVILQANRRQPNGQLNYGPPIDTTVSIPRLSTARCTGFLFGGNRNAREDSRMLGGRFQRIPPLCILPTTRAKTPG